MSNRWKGNFVVATAATSSGTDYTGKANGAWGLNSQLQQKQGGLWAKGVGFPTAPTIGYASAGASQATVSFTAPSDTGGGTLTYTATSTPGSITGTSATSPITVTGLTNGTAYTFTVKATNSFGNTGTDSAASNSVTPSLVFKPIVIGGFSVPSIVAYKFSSGSFGTRYTDPSSGMFGISCRALAFSNSGNYLLAGLTASPFIAACSWSTSGFGTQSANPSTLPAGQIWSVQANSANTYIIGSGIVSPYINAYSWSSGSFGTKSADPSTLPSSTRSACTFNPSGNTVATSGYNGSVILDVYPFTSGSFGTRYANPSSAFSSTNYGWNVKFSPSGNAIVVSCGSASPWINAYAWSNGFGSKYANPSTSLTDMTLAFTFNSTGTVIAGVLETNPRIYAYPWSDGSGFGTRFSDPSTAAGGAVSGITFDTTDTSIITSKASTLLAYDFNSTTGFGSKITDPSTAVGFQANAQALIFGSI